MADQQLAMLAYVQLALLAHAKGQLLPRDRFLVLAAASACRGGYAEVAESCRDVIATHSPGHMLSRFSSVAAALRDPAFCRVLRRREIDCPFEKAEHLLSGQAGLWPVNATDDCSQWCLLRLRQMSGA